MAIQRNKILNGTNDWDINRRYKVNAVVSYLGGVYQNLTGKNTNPASDSDWIKLGSDSVLSPYNGEFAYIDSQDFTLPNNTVVISVFYNKSLLSISDYNINGNILSIVPILYTDDIITINGINL